MSKPAIFLLSAKNCAGDLDCRFLSPPPCEPPLGGIFLVVCPQPRRSPPHPGACTSLCSLGKLP